MSVYHLQSEFCPNPHPLPKAKIYVAHVPRHWQEWMSPNVTKVLDGPMIPMIAFGCFWMLLDAFGMLCISPRASHVIKVTLLIITLRPCQTPKPHLRCQVCSKLQNLLISSGHKQGTSTSSHCFTSILSILNILEAFLKHS